MNRSNGSQDITLTTLFTMNIPEFLKKAHFSQTFVFQAVFVIKGKTMSIIYFKHSKINLVAVPNIFPTLAVPKVSNFQISVAYIHVYKISSWVLCTCVSMLFISNWSIFLTHD